MLHFLAGRFDTKVRARRLARKVRLAIDALEERATPAAYDLTIDGDANGSTSVSRTFGLGVTLFKAIGPNATLDVDDIEDALNDGDVVINSGTSGTQSGYITWTRTSDADDLEYFGIASRTLKIETLDNASAGQIVLTGTRIRFDGNVDVVLRTGNQSVSVHPIGLTAGVSIVGAASVSIDAGVSDILDVAATIEATGDVTISGRIINSLFLGASSSEGNVTINVSDQINIDGFGALLTAPAGTMTINGDVEGPAALSLEGETMNLNGSVGTAKALATLNLDKGALIFGADPIRATTLRVGDGVFVDEAENRTWLGAGTGTVTANVIVGIDGQIAPGGWFNPGTLTVVGNVTFDGGEFIPDLSPSTDRLNVTGNLVIKSGSNIDGYHANSGLLLPSDRIVIDYTGTRTGTFANAPLGRPILLGSEAVQVSVYGPTGGDIRLVRAPGIAGGKFVGHDYDGTQFTVQLTGPGELVVVGSGSDVVVRNTTATSKLSIKTTANASDAYVGMSTVRIHGGLSALEAPNVSFSHSIISTEAVKNLTIRDHFGSDSGFILINGQAADKVTIKANNILGNVIVGGRLQLLKVAGWMQGDLFAHSTGLLKARDWSGDVSVNETVDKIVVTNDFVGELNVESLTSFQAAAYVGIVTADVVGNFKVTGRLFGKGTSAAWLVSQGIQSISAGYISNLDLEAKYLNELKVSGTGPRGGEVEFFNLRLTGNNGASGGGFGLKKVTVNGNVRYSTFDVENGNVGPFKVGRFYSSDLFVNYTQLGNFNTGGAFDDANEWKLTSFTTTATTLNDSANLSNYAFTNSHIAAPKIGTVKLSGLNAVLGMPFGIKFKTPPVSAIVLSASDPAVPLNTKLTAGSSAIAGSFYLLDI